MKSVLLTTRALPKYCASVLLAFIAATGAGCATSEPPRSIANTRAEALPPGASNLINRMLVSESMQAAYLLDNNDIIVEYELLGPQAIVTIHEDEIIEIDCDTKNVTRNGYSSTRERGSTKCRVSRLIETGPRIELTDEIRKKTGDNVARNRLAIVSEGAYYEEIYCAAYTPASQIRCDEYESWARQQLKEEIEEQFAQSATEDDYRRFLGNYGGRLAQFPELEYLFEQAGESMPGFDAEREERKLSQFKCAERAGDYRTFIEKNSSDPESLDELAETAQARQLEIARRFRVQVSPGTQTRDGMVVELRPNIVQLQSDDLTWVHRSRLHPPKSDYMCNSLYDS